jgi:uncharacterized RDD family membrane protein YckC
MADANSSSTTAGQPLSLPLPDSGADVSRLDSGLAPPARTKKSRGRVQVLDNTLRVTTPENISFEYQLAGPFQRFLAYVVDVLLTVCGFGVLALVFYLLLVFVLMPLAISFGIGALVDTISGIIFGMLLVMYFLVYWFYGAFMETNFNGQTFGKRAAGLRVVSTNGHAIDGVQATLRNFFRLLDVWPMVSLAILVDARDLDPEVELLMSNVGFPTFLIGLVVMGLSRNFQRMGDLVANTVVISERKAPKPQLLTFSDPRIPMLAELIPNFVPSNHFAKAIASYVELRGSLYPQRANDIAAHVAVPLLEKFGMPADTNYDLLMCGLYYKLFTASKNTLDEESVHGLRASGTSRSQGTAGEGGRG